MTLPYSSATSGDKALGDLQKILRAFGCNRFGSMLDDDKGELLVQFSYRGRDISVKASSKGYAQAWLNQNPYSHRKRVTKTEWERRALEIGSIAIYSILRDWIKGQITAIETGVLSFEAAFLGQIMLPSGATVMEHVEQNKVLPTPDQKRLGNG